MGATEAKEANHFAPDAAIEAVLPVYDERGQGTLVALAGGGGRVYPVQLRTALRHLAARSACTLPLIRARMKGFLGGRQELPLAISPHLILVPVKARRPRVAGDATLGYINYAHFRGIERPSPAGKARQEVAATVCRLASGRRVPLLCTAATLRRHLQMAAYAKSICFDAYYAPAACQPACPMV